MFIVTVATDQQHPALHPADSSPSEIVPAPTRCELGLIFGFSLFMRTGDWKQGIYLSFLGKISRSELDMPFAKWTKEQVCNWLQDQGLGSYINNGRHWILSGQTLLQASQQDLEKVRNTKTLLSNKGKKNTKKSQFLCM